MALCISKYVNTGITVTDVYFEYISTSWHAGEGFWSLIIATSQAEIYCFSALPFLWKIKAIQLQSALYVIDQSSV